MRKARRSADSWAGVVWRARLSASISDAGSVEPAKRGLGQAWARGGDGGVGQARGRKPTATRGHGLGLDDVEPAARHIDATSSEPQVGGLLDERGDGTSRSEVGP